MADTIKKSTEGYGYKYADLAEIHKYLESAGKSYYQYITINEQGIERIFTKRDDMDEPIPGCKVPQATLSGKSNPAQEYGSALTYARRYSLLMAYGLATEDDDAESLTRGGSSTNRKSASTANSKGSTAQNSASTELKEWQKKIEDYAHAHSMTVREIMKDYNLSGCRDPKRLEEVYKDLTSASTANPNAEQMPDFAAIDEPVPFD